MSRPIGYITQSAAEAMRKCQDDDYNGYVEVWMRPLRKDDVPVYLHAEPLPDHLPSDMGTPTIGEES